MMRISILSPSHTPTFYPHRQWCLLYTVYYLETISALLLWCKLGTETLASLASSERDRNED